MVDNTDTALVSDVDIDRTLRLRPDTSGSNSNESQRARDRQNKLRASSPGPESDDETTRLLNPAGNNYGDEADEQNEAEEQEYLKEFSGLPWWKRPSVCA